MAEEVGISFLGERIKRLQGDVRALKSDVSQVKTDVTHFRSEQIRLESEFALLGRKIDALNERVDDRFDQMAELIKSSFRTLAAEIQSLRPGPRAP